MNILNIDSLENIFFFLNLDDALLLTRTNKKLYYNKDNLINKLINKKFKINNYNEFKNKIINLNNYNIFLDKLLYNNHTVINNYLNLQNNNKTITTVFRNYYILIKNIKNIKTIENKLLLKNIIYQIFKESLLYILTHYNSNHIIYFDIFKYKKKKNQLEMYINYNNTFNNYQKFYLLYLYLCLHKYI